MAATLWRGRSVTWKLATIGAAAIVICVVLVAAALVTDVRHSPAVVPAPAEAASNQTELPAPQPVLGTLSSTAAVPDPAALAAILDPLATSGAGGDITGLVVDNITGQPLWSKDPARPRVSASTTKLLTMMAAHLAIPGDARLPTTLAAAGDTLVVIPGGNVTMTKAAESTFFPHADTLDQLVALATKDGQQWTKVEVAPGPYEGPDMAVGWNEADIPGGYLTRAQAWMLDAGRVDPTDIESAREGQPMYAAAVELARRLGLSEGDVTMAAQPVAVDRELGASYSGTLNQRSRAIAEESDNVGADALCREVAMRGTGIALTPAVRAGHAGYADPALRVSMAESTAAVLAELSAAGIDTTGTTLEDCSGMSTANQISAQTLVNVLHYAAGPGATPAARALLDSLPIARGSGTLIDRFGPATNAAAGAGWVRAKTGTLTDVSTLAGVVTTADGRSLSFALMSSGTNPIEARPVLDEMAADMRSCGCQKP